jgi:hypothetical protein
MSNVGCPSAVPQSPWPGTTRDATPATPPSTTGSAKHFMLTQHGRDLNRGCGLRVVRPAGTAFNGGSIRYRGSRGTASIPRKGAEVTGWSQVRAIRLRR